MSQYHGHTKATYECVDVNAESIPGSHGGILMEVYSTMLKLPAMDYHVHHMMLRRSSPVLCALSDVHLNTNMFVMKICTHYVLLLHLM